MKAIKLSNGFQCKVNENVANDFELIKLLRKAQDDALVYYDVAVKILGDEKQLKKLEDSIRKDGIVPVANNDGKTYSLTDAITEILSALGKN